MTWLLNFWHWLAVPIGGVPFAHFWILAGWFSFAVNLLPKSTLFDRWPRFKANYELFVKLCAFLALNIRKRLPTLGIKIPGLGFDPNYSHDEQPAQNALVTRQAVLERPAIAVENDDMSLALQILMLVLNLAPKVVNTIEAVHGKAVAGADKKELAKTALTGAVDTAVAGFGANTDNGVLSQVVGALVGTVIDQTVTDNKANGTYQAAQKASLNLPLPAPAPAAPATTAPAAS